MHTHSGLIALLCSTATHAASLFYSTDMYGFSLIGSADLQDSLQAYIAKQGPISEQGMLNNTGKNIGGVPGVVSVAIPLPDVPSADFTWIRDSSMPYNFWLNRLTWGDTTLRSLIDDVTSALTKTQTVINPSGNITTGGLAETRFRFDLTADDTVYARPENDSPPLRAIAILRYANWLLEHGDRNRVSHELWPTLNIDLAWIAWNWNTPSFELWDTIWTTSFWTASLQYRALHSGAILAHKLGHLIIAKRYENQAKAILKYTQTFWDQEQGFMRANTVKSRSGIDSAAHLASVFNYDQSAGCDAATFQPCSDRALASLKVTIERFKGAIPMYKDTAANKPTPVGMYLEDPALYPWYMTTFAAAEQLYDALWTWDRLGGLTVTPTSLPFFALFVDTVRPGNYGKLSAMYKELTRGVWVYADGLVALCVEHSPEDGKFQQGWNGTTGERVGLVGLSWSYAASLTAFDAREGKTPVSWGATAFVGHSS